jgi:hypothetical protein
VIGILNRAAKLKTPVSKWIFLPTFAELEALAGQP